MNRMLFVLFAFSLCMADENGYVKKQPRTRETKEPDAVVGTMYTDDNTAHGTLYGYTIPLPEVTGSGITCSQEAEMGCWQACENELTDPFCCQSGSWCEGTANGGATCYCRFFCAKESGVSVEHKPRRLMVVPPVESGS